MLFFENFSMELSFVQKINRSRNLAVQMATDARYLSFPW
jgi:hypothetical protein